MTKTGNEEKFPLLLLYVEENGRRSEFPQRVVFADKGRAQVTSCWLTSIALGTGFIFISLLLVLSSLNPLSFPIHPRCEREVNEITKNKTIHLVKFGNNWTHKQLDILRFIAKTYPDFKIRNIMLDDSLKNFEKPDIKEEISTTTTEKVHFLMPSFTNNFVRKLNEILKRSIDNGTNVDSHVEGNLTKREKRNLDDSYENILKTYPNIQEELFTYKDYFSSTPLHYFWVDLSYDMMLFSVRVLEMWQNGGLSFHLPIHDHPHHLEEDVVQNISSRVPLNKSVELPRQHFDLARLKALIANTKLRYEQLSDEVVSIDGQGLHMATKTSCHAFFGEMILKLQKEEFATVSEFIQRILGVFCGRGMVDSDYCMTRKK